MFSRNARQCAASPSSPRRTGGAPLLRSVASAVPGSVAAVAASLALPANAQTWQNPFAANSIWNTPVGSGAVYVPCKLGVLGALANDRENLIVCSAADPFWNAERPDNGGDNPAGNLPHNYVSVFEANGCASLLQPDGVTLQEYN